MYGKRRNEDKKKNENEMNANNKTVSSEMRWQDA